MKTALELHIQSLNANARTSGFRMTICEDPKHWAESDVTTVAEFDRYMAIATYSDTFKEVYGCRPRMSYDSLSTEEINEQINSMFEELRYEAEERAQFKREEQAYVTQFCLEQGMTEDVFNNREIIIPRFEKAQNDEDWNYWDMEQSLSRRA